MLSYDSLITLAKERKMPYTKMRGILREYLQILILKEINKSNSGKNFYFTDGTYLRFVHNIKRFSEDLDFNIPHIEEKEFENLLEMVVKGLKNIGINSYLKLKYIKNVFVSKIIFPEIEKYYNVVSKYSKKTGIIIKVETNNPKCEIKKDVNLISGFGETYLCSCTAIGFLFADKIDAYINKNRGRDIYDIIFMLSHKYPIDEKRILSLGIEESLKCLLNKTASIKESELKKLAETLRPFLFDESEANLIINAKQVIPLLVEKYKNE